MSSINLLAKYGESIAVPLVFYSSAQALQDTISWVAGDVKIIKNGVDSGNAANLPTLVTGRKTWSIILTAAELEAKTILLEFKDQDAVPVFIDDVVTIQTYGNINASIPSIPATVGVGAIAANAISSGAIASAELNNIADALLKRDMSSVTGEASRSLLNFLRFPRNKFTIVGNTLTVYKEDDVTVAWTAVITTNASSDPITSLDPA